MLSLLFTNPIEFFVALIGLVISLTFHEFAHARVADRLGDPTPRLQGRVTLDPRAHLDPLGTLALVLVRFGWGKPVEIDPFNFKNPVRDSALVALAGPAANLILAGLLRIAIQIVPLPQAVMMAVIEVILINIVLAIFNLVPVYPLDGSKIVVPLLPRRLGIEYEQFMRQYGMFLLLALLIPWSNGVSPIHTLINPVIDWISHILF